VAAFHLSQEASATTAVGHSTMLASPVTGGVLLRTPRTLPGTAACATTVAMQTGTTSLSDLVFLSVVSGINAINLLDFLKL